MYDLKRIKEDLSCIEAAQNLGLKLKKTGTNYSMLCPAHNDRHFGSCFVYEHKWHCYACGAGGDVFSLIHEATGYTSRELFEEAARLTNYPERYKLDSEEESEYIERVNDFPLNKEELEFLGLKKGYGIPFIKNESFNSFEEGYKKLGYDDKNDAYLHGEYYSYSLVDMYIEDPEGFSYLIKTRVETKIKNLAQLLNKDLSLILPPELIVILENEIFSRLITARAILRKFS